MWFGNLPPGWRPSPVVPKPDSVCLVSGQGCDTLPRVFHEQSAQTARFAIGIGRADHRAVLEILTIYLGLSVVAGLIGLVVVHFAPVGYENETGFHYGVEERPTLPACNPADRQVLPSPA